MSGSATDAPTRVASSLMVVACTETGGAMAEQLAAAGCGVSWAETRQHARALADAAPVDLVLLGDLPGPRESLDLLEDIRGARVGDDPWDPSVPVIVLGGNRTAELDAVRAFELGADDYVAPPAGYLELRARVRALLRRCYDRAPRRLRRGSLEIDLAGRSVHVDGCLISLSRLEFELLATLAADPGRVFTKQELLRGVWGFRSPCTTTRTLDSHASRLRRKLGGAGASIVNVWGVGYRLAV